MFERIMEDDLFEFMVNQETHAAIHESTAPSSQQTWSAISVFAVHRNQNSIDGIRELNELDLFFFLNITFENLTNTWYNKQKSVRFFR